MAHELCQFSVALQKGILSLIFFAYPINDNKVIIKLIRMTLVTHLK